MFNMMDAMKNTIIYAGYGMESKVADVTEKVKTSYKNGVRNFEAKNELFGDPNVGKAKALYIIWTENGILKSAVVLENDKHSISLPNNITC